MLPGTRLFVALLQQQLLSKCLALYLISGRLYLH